MEELCSVSPVPTETLTVDPSSISSEMDESSSSLVHLIVLARMRLFILLSCLVQFKEGSISCTVALVEYSFSGGLPSSVSAH